MVDISAYDAILYVQLNKRARLMIDIHIKGGSKSQRTHATSLIRFVHGKFLSRMNYVRVNLRIKDLKDDALGYCLPSDDADEFRPREFDIEVHNKLPLRRFLQTVAHEMVHAKQFAKGELYESTRLGKHKWRGNWLPKANIDYWDQPWEIEAHGREYGLFIQWAEANDLGKYKWTQEAN